MKLIEYLQQPSSIYALMALLINTQAKGLFSVKDVVEWFLNQDVAVNVHELKQRWIELTELGLAERVSGGWKEKWKVRFGMRIGYVLTEKGDKATEALMEAVNYIKKL
jgi:hypothetical protein